MEYHHLSHIIHRNAEKFGDQEALKTHDKSTNTWISISWEDFSKKVLIVARSICHTGIKPKSNIGVYSQNMVECIYVDYAAFANRVTVIPMYATASVPQIKYMIEEAEIRILFVGEQQQYDNARQALKTSNFLKQIVIFDNSVIKDPDDKNSMYFDYFSSPKNRSSEDIVAVEKRMKEAQIDDIAHIIYTSGTGGEPKGVILTHENYIEVLRLHDIRLSYLPQRFLSICFLPMAHIFEKAWSIYCIYRGCTLAINLDPREITTTIKAVKPEAMCSVPRFWEKVYAGVTEKIENSNSIAKSIYHNAIETGRKYNLDYVNKGIKPSFLLKCKYFLYSNTIFAVLKKVIGIERGLIFPCAGAMLSENIIIFLRSVGIPLVYGYGLTETTATVCCYPSVDYELETVGTVMPEIRVRIGEENEIQVRGKSIMSGYYKKPKETEAAFTKDGWFKTGDAGKLTEKNGVVFTERIKDLYKTSNGKYIAPQHMEARLMDDKFIEGALIIGDQRKYVTALIIPAYEEVEKYATEHGIQYENVHDLCNNSSIIELFDSRIGAMQNEFAPYEQIKKFTLLSEPFSINTGELTNTLKMKRHFISEKFKEIIDMMYSE